METSIKQILRDHFADGVHHSHVSMIEPKGRYQFGRQDFEKFVTRYCEVIMTQEDPILGVAEKPQHYLPVLVDVDIKIELEDEEEVNFVDHIYSEDQVKQVVEVYQSVLRKIVEECSDENLKCILLEKDIYYLNVKDKSYAKNGFHLHFPNLFLSKVDQEVHLIPRVQEMLKEMRTFENLGFEDSGLIIDKACCKVPWLMYGSRKSEDMKPYIVSKVFDSEGNEIGLEEGFRSYQLFDMQERLINVNGKVREYLPRILSIIPYNRQTSELKYGLVSPLKEKRKVKEQKKHVKVSVTEALKVSARLLPMLSMFRSSDRTEWITVGWSLFNISDGCQEGLEQWLEFSARDEEKFDEAVCINEWERMTKKDLTIGTLRYYASVDNPQMYKEFQKEQSDHHIKESLSGSHNDIAKVLYTEYGNEFVCSSVTGRGSWFQFSNHHWEEVEEGVFLRQKISDEIVNRYVDMGNEFYAKQHAAEDKAEGAMYEARFKLTQKIITSLKSAPYKNNVMKECMEVFYDKRFRKKLDTNPYLIAFKNGVYDLKTHIFRAGRPEDFISKSMPIDYMEFSQDEDRILAVEDFLEKIFPDISVRQYFIDQASDVFVGGNMQKVVYFWTGEGDNGKSVTQSIFEKMFGELSIKFNTTLITGKKTGNGAANPELARAGNGVRWAVLEEPDGDEQINIGTMKSLSGNDSYWARDLFETGKATREMTPMFKLTFICNKLPKMRYSDKATWNRIRVIPFESTFVRRGEPCPETYAEQLREKRFPMDKEFSKKIPDLIQAFAWFLLKHHEKIVNDHTYTRREPEKIKEATAMYRKQNDIYRQFVEESVIDDDIAKISLAELYAQFKEWHREGFPGQQAIVKNEVKEYFIKTWGDPSRGCIWHGYRIRTLQDDIDCGNIVILGDEDLVDYTEDGKALPPL